MAAAAACIALPSMAAGDNAEKAMPKSSATMPAHVVAYSDRTRMTQWTSDKARLEKALGEGKSVAQYSAELKQMGYQITATNDREKDYVELEVVKGSDSYEVKIDLDDAGKGEKIDVAANLWKADATEKALEKNQ